MAKSKKESNDKKTGKNVIYLDSEALEAIKCVNEEKLKIIREIAVTEDLKKLKELHQFEESRSITPDGPDELTVEKMQREAFSIGIEVGKREGLHDGIKLVLRDLEKSKAPQSFVKRGDMWGIRYEGQEIAIKNLLGLQYIAYLLERPGQDVSCINLYQAANPTDSPIITKEQAAAEGLHINIRSKELNTTNIPKPKEDLANKYRELKADLDNAKSDLEKIKIEKEIDMIIRSLRSDFSRDPIAIKAQSNIKRSINRAINAIDRLRLKALVNHLEAHIRPDGAYGYSYTGGVSWEIIM